MNAPFRGGPACEAVELTLGLVHETEKAWLVTDTGFENDAVWIPKSLCEQLGRKIARADPPECPGGVWEFSMPEFIAIEKGLLT